MTYRERLKLEHPEMIRGSYGGGCYGCPHGYWPDATCGCWEKKGMSCTECWDREIPGAEEKSKNFGYIKFKDGVMLTITEYQVRENSTDCFIINFKSERGTWYTFKRDHSTGSAYFVQVYPFGVLSSCSIDLASVVDIYKNESYLLKRETPEFIGYILYRSGHKEEIKDFAVIENTNKSLVVVFKTVPQNNTYKFEQNKLHPVIGTNFYIKKDYNLWAKDRTIEKAVINNADGSSTEYAFSPDVETIQNARKLRELENAKTARSRMEIEYMKRDLQLTKDALAAVKKNYVAEKKRNKLPQIKNVIFNNPATIVFWDDGSKTVVKANGEDAFKPEVGLAMAISKKALGNGSSYFEVFKMWCEDENNNLITKDEHTQMKIDAAISVLEKVLIYANKPLKKDLEEAIDTALCHLTDISDSYRIYYPKEG